MSGHSKWSTIKRKKGAADAKRGKIFSRLNKEITIAARFGGGNPDANPRLRTAIAAAKSENMPKENIDRAIKKGVGEIDGVTYEEFNYEGYGPGGAAVLVEIMTDNKNRTASEIRHIFTKNNGNLAEAGCVSWLFNKQGIIVYDKDRVSEDLLMEEALEAGAEDIYDDENNWVVKTEPKDFYSVKEIIDSNSNLPEYSIAEITMVPQNTVKLTGKDAEQMLKLMDALEDHDDVQNVYSNFDIPEVGMDCV